MVLENTYLCRRMQFPQNLANYKKTRVVISTTGDAVCSPGLTSNRDHKPREVYPDTYGKYRARRLLKCAEKLVRCWRRSDILHGTT